MVKAAAARMTAQRIKPAARVAGIATRIAADISNPPVTRHHHAGYPHRTKLLRVVDVAIALNRPAPAKAAASSLMNIMCMAYAIANAYVRNSSMIDARRGFQPSSRFAFSPEMI
jgi:hypothetical protein